MCRVQRFGSVEGIDKWFSVLVLAFFIIPGLPTVWHLWKENKDEILGRIKSIITRTPYVGKPEEEPEV